MLKRLEPKNKAKKYLKLKKIVNGLSLNKKEKIKKIEKIINIQINKYLQTNKDL